MDHERGNWYLFTGLLIGLFLGILFTRLVQPPSSMDTAPESLQAVFLDEYRLLIARAYQADGDLVRAKARLDLLHDEDPRLVLEQQAQRILASGAPEQDARALAQLAADLQQER